MVQTLINSLKYLFDGFEGFPLLLSFILHFLCGPGQTREMESQWGEEVGSKKNYHQTAEKAAGEGNCMQIYFALRSTILIFWASFFVYIEFICTFVKAFFKI